MRCFGNGIPHLYHSTSAIDGVAVSRPWSFNKQMELYTPIPLLWAAGLLAGVQFLEGTGCILRWHLLSSHSIKDVWTCLLKDDAFTFAKRRSSFYLALGNNRPSHEATSFLSVDLSSGTFFMRSSNRVFGLSEDEGGNGGPRSIFRPETGYENIRCVNYGSGLLVPLSNMKDGVFTHCISVFTPLY